MNSRVAPQHLIPPTGHQAPDLGRLDFLGRMPIPLRRPFKAGLDQVLARQRREDGRALNCCFLAGGEWYHPFDGLAAAGPEGLPGMLVTTFYHDILHPALLAHYAPGPDVRQSPRQSAHPPDCHPACLTAGLADPEGVFRLFSVIPFVFLVDEKRLQGRRPPTAWADLLDPCWADDIVFGGWRPDEQSPYQDYNSYLLLSLAREFGAAGLQAFAHNVKHLQHNIRTATQAGSNARSVGAIAILPWLQAELCPRRERTRVVWPRDGALAMPIGYLLRPGREARLAPLVDYLTGPGLAAVLARNCYPPTRPGVAAAFPAGAKLKWVGWDYARSHDMAAESRQAADTFFQAWYGKDGESRACS